MFHRRAIQPRPFRVHIMAARPEVRSQLWKFIQYVSSLKFNILWIKCANMLIFDKLVNILHFNKLFTLQWIITYFVMILLNLLVSFKCWMTEAKWLTFLKVIRSPPINWHKCRASPQVTCEDSVPVLWMCLVFKLFCYFSLLKMEGGKHVHYFTNRVNPNQAFNSLQ